MKHCPKCNTTFTDDYLIYCTDDGTSLLSGETPSSSQATQVFAPPPVTMVMPPPAATDYGLGAPARQPQPPQPQPYGWANSAPPAWTPVPAPVAPRPVFGQQQQQQQTMAIVALVFGIASITFGWICGGPVLALVAVILGLVAFSQIKRDPIKYGGKPLALGGLITGGIVLLFYTALLVFWIVMLIIGAASSH